MTQDPAIFSACQRALASDNMRLHSCHAAAAVRLLPSAGIFDGKVHARHPNFTVMCRAKLGSDKLAGSATQEMAVANSAHPAGTAQVAVDHALGPLGLLGRIDAKDDLGHFVLACAVGGRVQQT